MMKYLYVGVDPGATGALVILNDYGHFGNAARFTSNGKHINIPSEILTEITALPSVIYIEDVHAMPGQGGTSMFSFGRALGQIEGALKTHGKLWQIVTPQRWQKELHLSTPYPTKTQRKQAHVKKAYDICPSYKNWVDEFPPKQRNKIALETADAVLIAMYAWRVNNGI